MTKTILLVAITLLLSGIVNAQNQDSQLNECRPAFDYNGELHGIRDKYKKVPDSQQKTRNYTSVSHTLTTKDGKLEVYIDDKKYNQFPAKEYAIRLKNISGKEPTGIISNFRSLKFSIEKKEAAKSVTLNVLRGSTCNAKDFIPEIFEIESGKGQVLTTSTGRSSSNYIPFFELNMDDLNGYLIAVGWTGSWKAGFSNTSENIEIEIGMEETNFRLLPKESISQPSILVIARRNQTHQEFMTLVHRFMLENKVPRDSKGEVIPPILAVASGGGNKTPQMMADILQYCTNNKLPFDTYWIDAGWYGAPHEDELYSNCGPNWYKYVGDWRVNTTTHPTGNLLPIANAVHAAGMKFLLWFEPERMTDIAPILQRHPEFRHDQLVDYGNPETLKWIQETVYGIIAQHQIDVYRQDFNIDPGPIWKGMDAEDRIGIAEAKHIAGMYQFLDDMRTRFPDILQENCASGGRRIDMEMISRAHTYCRSDYFIGRKPDDSAFILGQNATLNLTPYLPFQGCEFNCVPVGDDYGAFSIISSGTVITPSDFDGGIIQRTIPDEETAWFKKVFDVANRMKPFYMGDFYQLTNETGAGNDIWCAWQCDRPDQNAGFAMIFRRGDATEESRAFQLGGIDSSAKYSIEFYDGTEKTVKGSQLENWNTQLEPRSFQLFFYRKL